MKNNYILITPVHNEEKMIGKVIESVLSQTVLPQKWLIVNDGSTDATADIVKGYSEKHAFIEHYYLHRDEVVSYYARKTNVLLAGYEKIKDFDFDFVATLDADLTFEGNYYENILIQFDQNPKLGIACGVYLEKLGGQYRKTIRDYNFSTSGGLQMFRKECYKEIGGYIPLRYGGEDSCMDIKARMCGWQTKSFPEYNAIHLRPVGVRKGKVRANIWKVRFRQGLTDFGIGTHPVFMFCKCLRRLLTEKPRVISGICRFWGYQYGYIVMRKAEVPDDIKKFLRKEQLFRLFRLVKS